MLAQESHGGEDFAGLVLGGFERCFGRRADAGFGGAECAERCDVAFLDRNRI